MNLQHPYQRAFAVLFLAFSLALAACGIDAGVENTAIPASTSTTAASTNESPTSAPEATTVTQGGGGEATATIDPDEDATVPADNTEPPADSSPATEETAPVAPTETDDPGQEATETPFPEDTTPAPEPTEGPGLPSDVDYGTAAPEPTNTPYPTATRTPKPAPPRIEKAVVMRGEPDPSVTKSITNVSLKERKLSVVGQIENPPEYGSLYARLEAVELPGLRIIFSTIAEERKDVDSEAPFAFTFDLDAPPYEGKYKVSLVLNGDTLKEIPLNFTAPVPRILARPGRAIGGGTGRLVLKFPKNVSFWEYIISDEDGERVAQLYGNSLEFEETPGVHQLPPGTYTVEWKPALYSGIGNLFRVVVEAGRESVAQLGALKIVSGQVPEQILLVDLETGRRAGGDRPSGGDDDDSLLKKPLVYPPGRYAIYFESGNRLLQVGEVTVKPGLVATVNI